MKAVDHNAYCTYDEICTELTKTIQDHILKTTADTSKWNASCSEGIRKQN